MRRRPAASVSLSTGGSFNSRLREEATAFPVAVTPNALRFNSRLREEATTIDLSGEIIAEVSTHASVRRRLVPLTQQIIV